MNSTGSTSRNSYRQLNAFMVLSSDPDSSLIVSGTIGGYGGTRVHVEVNGRETPLAGGGAEHTRAHPRLHATPAHRHAGAVGGTRGVGRPTSWAWWAWWAAAS